VRALQALRAFWSWMVWLRRRPPKPPAVAVVRRDPVFGVELEGAPPGEIHGMAGGRQGTFSAGPTTVSKVWKAALPMRTLVAEAVRQVRTVGGRVTSVACSEPVDVRFCGEKVLPSGELAHLEIRGRGADAVATIRLTLSVGASPRRRGGVPPPRPRRPRIDGACAPDFVAVLDERTVRPFDT
jgi:hypothetical protein